MEDTRTEQQKQQDDLQEKEMYAKLAEEERIEQEYNDKILSELGISGEDFKDLLDGAWHHGKIEIVEKPKGMNQEEECGIFKEVYVEQWSNGYEGDSWAGYIYGKLEENKWVKISYEC